MTSNRHRGALPRAFASIVVAAAAAAAASCAWWGADATVPASARAAPASPQGVRVEREPGAELDGGTLVSPTQLNFDRATPGTSRTFRITVRNRRRVTTRFVFARLGMLPAEELGRTVRFVEEDEDEAAITAASWLRPAVESLELRPGEVAHLDVHVEVPRDASPGGHYAALAVRPADATHGADTPQVGVQGEVAVALLAIVPGDVERDFELRALRSRRIAFHGRPYDVRVQLRNGGNVHQRFAGTVRVRGLFGTAARFPLRSPLVLPRARSAAEVTWKGVPWLGIYRLQVELTPVGEHAPRVTERRWIVALPRPWILAAITLLAIVGVLRLSIRRGGERGADGYGDDPLHDHDAREDDSGDRNDVDAHGDSRNHDGGHGRAHGARTESRDDDDAF